jgi:RNA polymerase sigma-70 factor, ECF subfamily
VGSAPPRFSYWRASASLTFLNRGEPDATLPGVAVVSGLVTRRLLAGESAKEPVIPIGRAGTKDVDLAAALIDGDSAAIAELYDRFQAVVRKMLIRTLGSANEVEDLTQETFLVVLRRISTLRDPQALSSFVIGSAIRVARNELRKRAIRRWVGLDDGTLAGVHPDPELRDSVMRVYRALERLDASSRVLFVLRHVEELELTELAAALDVSLSTAKRRLAQAERRFEAIARNDPVLCRYLEGDP